MEAAQTDYDGLKSYREGERKGVVGVGGRFRSRGGSWGGGGEVRNLGSRGGGGGGARMND